MCLTGITACHRIPKRGVGKGWKIFRRHSTGKLLCGFMHYLERFLDGTMSKRPDLVMDQWLEDSSEGLIRAKLPGMYNPSNGNYRTGFHIFVNSKDAERVLEEFPPIHSKLMETFVLEVEYNDVVAEGVQSFGEVDGYDIWTPMVSDIPVIVARKMKILNPLAVPFYTDFL